MWERAGRGRTERMGGDPVLGRSNLISSLRYRASLILAWVHRCRVRREEATYLPVYLSLSFIFLSDSWSIHLFIHLSIFPPMYLSVEYSVFLRTQPNFLGPSDGLSPLMRGILWHSEVKLGCRELFQGMCSPPWQARGFELPCTMVSLAWRSLSGQIDTVQDKKQQLTNI